MTVVATGRPAPLENHSLPIIPNEQMYIVRTGSLLGVGFAEALNGVLSAADKVAAESYNIQDGGVAALLHRHLDSGVVAFYRPPKFEDTLDGFENVVGALKSLREELLSQYLPARVEAGLFTFQEEKLSAAELLEQARRIYGYEIGMGFADAHCEHNSAQLIRKSEFHKWAAGLTKQIEEEIAEEAQSGVRCTQNDDRLRMTLDLLNNEGRLVYSEIIPNDEISYWAFLLSGGGYPADYQLRKVSRKESEPEGYLQRAQEEREQRKYPQLIVRAALPGEEQHEPTLTSAAYMLTDFCALLSIGATRASQWLEAQKYLLEKIKERKTASSAD